MVAALSTLWGTPSHLGKIQVIKRPGRAWLLTTFSTTCHLAGTAHGLPATSAGTSRNLREILTLPRCRGNRDDGGSHNAATSRTLHREPETMKAVDGPPIIGGEHTVLRQGSPSDLDLLSDWFVDPEVYAGGTATRSRARRWPRSTSGVGVRRSSRSLSRPTALRSATFSTGTATPGPPGSKCSWSRRDVSKGWGQMRPGDSDGHRRNATRARLRRWARLASLGRCLDHRVTR
jgi:hypothetical protein